MSEKQTTRRSAFDDYPANGLSADECAMVDDKAEIERLRGALRHIKTAASDPQFEDASAALAYIALHAEGNLS